ncbi:MAG: hypothetical protein H7288_22715 [Kineosporiaceae bacterium]|nr:hypothetical protein [Aeromicrobium sp.]
MRLGSGQTVEYFEVLATLACCDLTAARVAETVSNSSFLINAETTALIGAGRFEKNWRIVPNTAIVVIPRGCDLIALAHRRGRGISHGCKDGPHDCRVAENAKIAAHTDVNVAGADKIAIFGDV